MGQAPCSLCGYQRAFIFPLTVILAVACLQSEETLQVGNQVGDVLKADRQAH